MSTLSRRQQKLEDLQGRLGDFGDDEEPAVNLPSAPLLDIPSTLNPKQDTLRDPRHIIQPMRTREGDIIGYGRGGDEELMDTENDNQDYATGSDSKSRQQKVLSFFKSFGINLRGGSPGERWGGEGWIYTDPKRNIVVEQTGEDGELIRLTDTTGGKQYIVRLATDFRNPSRTTMYHKRDNGRWELVIPDSHRKFKELGGIQDFLYGITDLDRHDDPEQVAVNSIRTAVAAAGPVEPHLIQRFENSASRSYKEADQERASRSDPRRHDIVALKQSKSNIAKQSRQILHVFTPEVRLRDGQRGMKFLKTHPDAVKALESVKMNAFDQRRAQYGLYADDILKRMTTTGPNNSLMQRRRPQAIGQDIMSSSSSTMENQIGLEKRLLNLPVYSSAQWNFSASKKRKGPYTVGYSINHLLSSKMGLETEAEQLSAKKDAATFFKKNFGINFELSGAVMEPYSITKTLNNSIHQAEGHLASWYEGSEPDSLGNGRVRYETGLDSDNTDVTEIGWMVRATHASGLKLRNLHKQRMVMPKGEFLVSGYWILERPGAAPSLLHFQSSKPSVTTASRDYDNSAIQHVTKISTNVYDMLHDSRHRPLQGVGDALTKIFKTKDDIEVQTMLAMRH